MTAESDKKIYEEAIKKWGRNAQVDVCQEECAELICALSAVKRQKHRCMADLVEELADVKIMVEQMVYSFKVEDEVRRMRNLKLHRLSVRLND